MLIEMFLFFVIAWLFFSENPAPIFGKYQVPGPRFWIKYVIFRLILFVRKLRSKPTLDSSDRPIHPLKDKERPQKLGDHPLACDAVFFMGANLDGFYVVAGSERRKHGIVNGLFYVMVPGIGLLRSKKMPDTVLFGGEDTFFGAEGLKITVLEPLKKWKIVFSGVMHSRDDPTREFDVHLDVIWSSEFPIFNFESDLHPHAIAKSMATEPWSREYFQSLKRAHQTHYEQMGWMKGTLSVGEERYELRMMSMRDHTIADARDWDLMHRYAFHMIFLKDGTMATVGVINQPCTCSRMECGFVCTPDGVMHPLEWCDLLLYQHGEHGTPPLDHAFTFKAGGKEYCVQVNVKDMGEHFVGWRWEARMIERFVTYNVNGIEGCGVSEFHYHNSKGRDPAAALTDPEWFKDVLKNTYQQR